MSIRSALLVCRLLNVGTTDLGLSRISNKFNAARHGSAPGDNGCNIIFQVSTAGFVHDYNL